MKRIVYVVSVMTAVALASCGGGDGGPTPTPTSDGTKVVTQAVSDEVVSAAGEGTLNGFQNMTPTAMVVKGVGEKTAYAGNISTTHNCGEGEASGTIGVSGTFTASCTESDANWNCSSMNSNMQLTFTNCARTATVGGTNYNIIMNGTGTATMTGSASGPTDGISDASFSGTLTGTPTITGDLTGTIDLGNLKFSGAVEGELEPVVTCSGTTTVTLDSTEQVCAISTDCSTCTE